MRQNQIRLLLVEQDDRRGKPTVILFSCISEIFNSCEHTYYLEHRKLGASRASHTRKTRQGLKLTLKRSYSAARLNLLVTCCCVFVVMPLT